MKKLLSSLLVLMTLGAVPAVAQLSVVDRFDRSATTDLSTSPPPYKWVKLLNQDDPSASLQINADSTVSVYNALGDGHMGGVAWDSLFTDTSQAAIIVTQKGGDGINGTFFLNFRMNSEDGSAANGYRLAYIDNPSGVDKVILQRVTSGVNTGDLVSIQREIQVGDTLIVKVEADKTMKGLICGANGVRDSIVTNDNTYNPSSWYIWLRGYQFATPAKFTDFMFGRIPADTTHPVFSVTPTTLSFGAVAGGNSAMDSVSVQNTGDGTLRIYSAAAGSIDYTVRPVSALIPAGSSVKFYVTFSPTHSGSAGGTLYFNHNAAGTPGTVSLSGSGSGGSYPVPAVTG
ncbi:MAG TPA: choice-of-anchor D domain-containing protein, partial [Bacteroidota bacterium]|nr:choice-of-anchor D domain-containing protein [Bacteroidota bacterium]